MAPIEGRWDLLIANLHGTSKLWAVANGLDQSEWLWLQSWAEGGVQDWMNLLV